MQDYRELADQLDSWAKTDALLCNLLREAAAALRAQAARIAELERHLALHIELDPGKHEQRLER